MKTLLLAALTLIGLLGTATEALAHGGSYRGPVGDAPPGARLAPPPPPPAPCRCARVDCTTCADEALRSGERLARADQTTEVVRAWADVRRVRVSVTFRAKDTARPIEAYAMVSAGTAFGVTGATIRQSDTTLYAKHREGEFARPDYLDTVRRMKDPLLLSRRAPGEHELRAFPVRSSGDTVVVVEGLALTDVRCKRTQLYFEGDRYLAVIPLRSGGMPRGAALVDRVHRRALCFLDRRGALARFRLHVAKAQEVPGVAALERAVLGNDDMVWVAVEGDDAPPAEPVPDAPVSAALAAADAARTQGPRQTIRGRRDR